MDAKVYVTKNEYVEVLGYTFFTYFSGAITQRSSLTGGKRGFGEYAESFVFGKLAEVCMAKFMRENLKIDVVTDLDLPEFIKTPKRYLPDVLAFSTGDAFVPAKFWIEVKEVKINQKWLLIPVESVVSRPCDAYVAVKVGLPMGHLAPLISSWEEIKSKMSASLLSEIKRILQNIEKIECEVMGFVLLDDVLGVLGAKNVLSIEEVRNKMSKNFPELESIVGKMSEEEWEKYLNKKYGENCWNFFPRGEPLYDPEGKTEGKKKSLKVREHNVGFALNRLHKGKEWEVFEDLILSNEEIVKSKKRERAFLYMKKKLEKIQKKYGRLKREANESWFSQELEIRR